MVEKAGSERITRKLACRDLIPMTTAKLPELQSSIGAVQLGGKRD